MGYHLQADVAHDFGAGAPVYNIGGAGAAARVGAPNTTEDGALEFFLNGPGGAIIADLAARKSGEIIFTVPDKTASFQNWKAPLLFQGGNDKIGIIQDAGEFITQRIGAANVIAFGSILDPAGKPIAPDQDPIWFQPAAAANQVPIELKEFGFDPGVLREISIRDLVAGSVKAIYVTPDGGMIDGVSMKPPGNQRGKAKPINTTDVDKAGFFTSIKKVENIDRELVTKGVFPNTRNANDFVKANLPYFYIGKTLGDAMLVASAMPKFGATPNPYYGIGASGWKSWSDGSAKPSPTLLALKTGDRLNWLRAIIKSVPTIYEDQAKGGRKTKQYRFFPGIADPRAVHTAIIEDFAKIKADVIRRYTEVSNNLSLLLLQADLTIGRLTFARGAINPALTTFAPGGDKVIKTATGAALAGQLINNIRAGLLQQSGTTVTGGLCKLVLDWVDVRERAVRAIPLGSKNQEVRQIYEQTVERANAASPASSAIQIKKGSDLPYLTMKLLIANIPPGVKGYPLPISYDIALRNAFSALNGANAVTSTDYESRVTGTDIYNRFLSKLPASSSASSSAAPAPAPAPAPASSSGPTTRSMAAAAAAQRGGDPPTLDEAVQALLTDQIGEQTSTAISPPIAIADTVSEVVGATISDTPNLSEPRGTAATGGAVLMRVKLLAEPQEFPTILADAFPRIADFAAYANWYLNAEPTAETIRQRTSLVHPMVKEGATKQEVQAIIGQYAKIFLIIHDIVKKRNTGRVVDLELCNDLVAEFKTILKDPEPLVSAHEPRIEIKNVDTRIFDPNYGAPQTPATPIGENLFLATPLQVNSSTATVLFDAYTYYVNARNAYIPTGPDFKSVETQAVVDYQALEFAYLTKLAPVVSRLRSGKTLPFYEFEIEPPPVEAVIKAEESAAETEEGRVRDKRQLKEDREMPPDRRARETTGSMNIEPSMLPSSASSSSSEPLIGGLRNRRPLYAKNVRSSGTLGDDNGGDNQGLRKRSRARATPRVRKHSRGSKTRRQRKYVDRV
jgi:hypothetical protein